MTHRSNLVLTLLITKPDKTHELCTPIIATTANDNEALTEVLALSATLHANQAAALIAAQRLIDFQTDGWQWHQLGRSDALRLALMRLGKRLAELGQQRAAFRLFLSASDA